MTWPPSSLPSGLVVAGSTTSAISDREALIGFPFKMGFFDVTDPMCLAILSSAGSSLGPVSLAAILPAHHG
jgi:hypothetical protein